MHAVKRDRIISDLLALGVSGDNLAITRGIGQAMQDAKRLRVTSMVTDRYPPGGKPSAITVTLCIELPPETNETWEEFRQKMHDVGGSVWDKIADPDGYIRWMRGSDDPAAVAAAKQVEEVERQADAKAQPPG